MAAVAQRAAEQDSDLLRKLSLDSQAKALDIPEPTKKIKSFERPVSPAFPNFMDPSICYHPNGYPSPAYYFGGYNSTGNGWDDYSAYMGTNGADSFVYGETGSFMHHHGYGYGPYGPYSPATSPASALGTDGQLYGPQQYQYPAPYFRPLTHTSKPFSPSQVAPSKVELSTSTAGDQKPLPVEIAKGDSNCITSSGNMKRTNDSNLSKPKYQSSYGRGAFAGGIRSPIPWMDGSSFSKGGNIAPVRNQNFYRNSHFMGSNHGLINRMHQNKFYGQHGNSFRSGLGFGYSGYNMRTNGHGWLTIDDRYKPRRENGCFGYCNENIDGLNELNRGPRAKGFKNQKGLPPALFTITGQSAPSSDTNNEEKDKLAVTPRPDREQYNRADFLEDYADAKFFIIKSYSEDDVHKSVKYNVWASTQNGNRKLDAAYQQAQRKSGCCPVFLFFSVNTSGQFVGLAEMVGPVDFQKNVEYWQQDKWMGYFPVKWHILKDVPNNLLKHLTLENNENKPVTNSRDTQEVKLEQGLKMIKIFKDHSSETCILDDFGFYEGREKIIKERKAKQQQITKQIWEGRTDYEKKELSQNSLEVVADSIKEPTLNIQLNGDLEHSKSDLDSQAEDASEGGNLIPSEKRSSANGC